ncbi:hypothetical protein HPG69_000323 [Diceros bicornis minor]|uniref:Uncharacterized protein n=1 Tax=Diceros bicornis minor TaxID=77932 RepID=A0A7J7EV69_DICBM|nr:hypothetical protein HPG69_000323 [Diceros bicornis minor]
MSQKPELSNQLCRNRQADPRRPSALAQGRVLTIPGAVAKTRKQQGPHLSPATVSIGSNLGVRSDGRGLRFQPPLSHLQLSQILLRRRQPWSMASPKHPGGPGWMGHGAQCMAGTKQETSATGPDLPRPGPEGHLGGLEAWGVVGG